MPSIQVLLVMMYTEFVHGRHHTVTHHYALRAAAALLLQNKLLNLTKCSKILANNISSNISSSAHLQRNFSAMCTQVDVDGPSIVTSVHVDVGVGPWSIQSCLACFR